MNKNIYILLLVFSISILTKAQQAPASKQSKSILILNATAHLGNGEIIENSAIGFVEGKITLVADARLIKLAQGAYDITIDASGKHVYPGFIAPNSTLGLVEIDAIKSSDDESEIGNMNPHVRSIIAYNADSKVIETIKPNGILMAQITPRGGRISGTSSIVQLDAWNWKDALIKENDGIHLNFPSSFKRSGSWFEPGTIEANKDYSKQHSEITTFLTSAKAYLADSPKERNLIFEATKGLFDGNQTLFIHANEEKQIIDAIQMAKENGVKKIVIVGGYEAYKTADLLQKNNIGVLLKRVHDMPENEDHDIDLPYKNAKLLTDKGVVVGLENSGSMERMNTRNLPFLAGTCAAYGLDKEKALQLITFNTAKLLGIDKQCGTLEQGKDATLFISEGDALDMRTNKLTNAFIQGRMISLETHQTKMNDIYKTKYNQK
ncbi:amidohydrolase [Flavobacterium sp. GSP27]|uniref:amidohydrolase family protein n=1 Tax=unclassified Flavobacterium TaxID=196869 RepID=UPI000F842F48|nr:MULTISPECIES: amidohydrolase family protein [unclassified Flavobacterium]RTY94807.1 amidohydrolase [Flavobacterium sp. GSN2]RTY67727.1 amidohydrolase [Flavobacterium sp. LB2P53]RTY73496.1 amidohydrolase [Flavobacterium sp. LS1R10]RTY79226.1 amidohydrolase [Flavobacterium sp. LS1P28]RTY81609.1 amidohydrolase [Flavobacterium sp. ZB4P23]